jgi:multidrug resistance efflux pump
MKKKLIITILIVASVSAVLLFMFKPETEALVVNNTTTLPIERTSISQTVFSDGVIAAHENYNLYSKVSSTVLAVYVDEGDSVKIGDVIAVLDTTDLIQSLKSAEYQLKIDSDSLEDIKTKGNSTTTANYQKALNSYNNATADHTNNKSLFNAGIISSETLTNSQATLDSAYVSYLTAKDSLNTIDIGSEIEQMSLKVDIEAATITSPTNGTIVSAITDVNKSISQGELLYSIEDLNNLVVEATISEYEINEIQIGQEVLIEALSHNTVYHGTIISIAPKGSTSTEVTIPITVEITDEDLDLKPNYTANIEIIVASKDAALVVPFEAITETNRGSMLMISRNGEEMMIPVEKGIISDVYIEIISDKIIEGDEIIITTYTSTPEASGLPLPGMGLRTGGEKSGGKSN